jgi:hypothetical protein
MWVNFLRFLERNAFTRHTYNGNYSLLEIYKGTEEFRPKQILPNNANTAIILVITCSRREGCSPPSPEHNFVT